MRKEDQRWSVHARGCVDWDRPCPGAAAVRTIVYLPRQVPLPTRVSSIVTAGAVGWPRRCRFLGSLLTAVEPLALRRWAGSREGLRLSPGAPRIYLGLRKIAGTTSIEWYALSRIRPMNAQMLRRLFKAINEGAPALNRVASEILDEQRRRGHGRLATQLEAVLKEHAADAATRATPPHAGAVVHELRPLSQRQELMVTITRPELLQHHMVLADAVEERFVRIEQEFAARDRLAKHGLVPRRRILLYGPPGCGKTLGAHRLAWTTALPLMQVRFDSLVSSLFGETASNLRKVFEHAQRTPSVLLLDECDYIAKSRVARHDIGEVSRIVNTLLQLLDEFRGPGLVVATTNIDRELDPALFRRFDDAFQIPAPTEAEIQRLLRMALSGVPVSKQALSLRLAKELVGASAADVVRIAQDAAKLAVLEGARQVDSVHFDRAKDIHNSRENPV